MNIKDAKNEVKNIVISYLAKDALGMPLIPEEHQRPVLLMGPPGIGKTAIMEQIASELHINLVSYTITHHTRQSAIGLPRIVVRSFAFDDAVRYHDNNDGDHPVEHAGSMGRNQTAVGQTASDHDSIAVTEYTMSEIIAEVYAQIERSGIREGILFLDEINCVSETLAPTMLQFLQFKTFGTHKVPEGFVIVTAGNPPQYNNSVREFDIVTLDRVRRIDIEPDYAAFKEYGLRKHLHGAILAYLEIRKDRFFSVVADTERKSFVTARGWEDLSDALKAHETLGLPVSEAMISEFLREPEIAGDFAIYYELYRKHRSFYQIPAILAGETEIHAELKDAPFDEKLSLIALLRDALNAEFVDFRDELVTGEALLAFLREYGTRLQSLKDCAQQSSLNDEDERQRQREKDAGQTANPEAQSLALLREMLKELSRGREQKKLSGMLDHEAERDALRLEKAVQELREILRRQTSVAETLAGKSAGTRDSGPEALAGTAEEVAEKDIAGMRDSGAGALAGKSDSIWKRVTDWFNAREELRQAHIRETDQHLTNAFTALEQAFGEGQEIVLFLSELNAGYYSLKFLNECGNDAYYRYNRMLLLKDRTAELRQEVLRLSEMSL